MPTARASEAHKALLGKTALARGFEEFSAFMCERQTQPGKTGAFTRSTGLAPRAQSRLCLTYAVAMTQRLVNACSTRCLGLANARLLANSGLAAFLAMPKVVRAREAVGRLTVVALVVGGRAATAIHTHGAHQTQKTRKVGRLAEGRGAKSRTLVSTRPSMSSCSALWQIWHRSGGGGVNVQRGGF
jgi:hypothetical protein